MNRENGNFLSGISSLRKSARYALSGHDTIVEILFKIMHLEKANKSISILIVAILN